MAAQHSSIIPTSRTAFIAVSKACRLDCFRRTAEKSSTGDMRNTNISDTSQRSNRWLVLVSSIVGMSAGPSQLAFGSLALFIMPLGIEFGWDRAEISLASSFFTLALLVSLPVAGRLADTYGSRRLLLPSIAVVGVSLAAIPLLVTELWHFWTLFAVIGGLGAGANALPYMRTISAWFDRKRGLAIGLTLAGAGLGYAYIPPVLRATIDRWDWRAAYLLLAGLCLLIALPTVAALFREPDSIMRRNDSRIGDGMSPRQDWRLGAALSGSVFWRLFVVFGLLSFSLYGLMVHSVSLLTDRGMSDMSAAFGASTIGLAIMGSRVVVGFLCDRFFAPRVAVLAFGLSAAGISMLAFGAVDFAAYTALILVGFSIGAEIDMMTFLTTRYYGLRHFGEIYGVLFASLLIGTSIGPYLFGLQYERSGSYTSILWVAALLVGVATIVCTTLPPYARTPEAPDDSMD